ncbi:MAG: tetratricopeptide repeat protein [Chloroflexi bacterium]|nr:tetratricopeptide repeat protein [Chloroflexota bacterium]
MTKIYISSTYSDLVEHRQQVYDILRKMRYDVIAMEDYVATDRRPLDKCLADVASCDLYVGIFAWRYGHIPDQDNPEQLSITELEYRKAGEEDIPRLIFLLDEGVPWPRNHMDEVTGEGERGQKIKTLRQELMAAHTLQFFKSSEELAGQVAASVSRWAQAQLDDEMESLRARRDQVDRERREMRDRQRVVNLRPLDVTHTFKDRLREIRALCEHLADASVRLISVVGRGGMGKTALASRVLADLERGKLPVPEEEREMPIDGILYLSARSTGLGLERIYADVGRMLGEPAAGELAACWADSDAPLAAKVEYLLETMRDELYLILLDNLEDALAEDGAIAEEGLRLFVEGCLTQPGGARLIVTSREEVRLAASALPGARSISLREGLPEDDAVALLCDLDPQGRLGLRDAPEDDLRRAARLTQGIPRALEILAGILHEDSTASLPKLLANETVFEVEVVEQLVAEGHRRLGEDQRRIMEALAAFDRPMDETAIAYLLHPWFPGLDVQAGLRRLVSGYFVSANRVTGEYSLHPLDRDYAYRKLPNNEAADAYNRRNLELRAADFYMGIRKPESEWKTIDDLAPQLAELEHRVRAGDYDSACRVLELIDHDYLFPWGHYAQLVEMREKLLGRLTAPSSRAGNLRRLGCAYHSLGQVARAIELYQEALAIAREISDRWREGINLGRLGSAYRDLGEIERAIKLLEESLTITREIGDRREEGIQLGRLGRAYRALGQIERAIEFYEEALAITREIGGETGDRREEGGQLGRLGVAYRDLGQVKRAIEVHEQALAITREIGDRREEGVQLGNLGRDYKDLGKVERAIELLEDSLTIAREISDRRREGIWLGHLGDAYCALGQVERAIEVYEQALTIARGMGDRRREGAQFGRLGDAYRALGQVEQAIGLCEEALAISHEIGDRWGESYQSLRLGSALLAERELYEASQRCQQARDLDMPRTSYQAALVLGIVLLHQHDEAAGEAFADAAARCQALLHKTADLYEPRYILAAALVGQAVCDPRWAEEDEREALLAPALEEYQRALEICAAPGVVRDALHDLEMIRAAGIAGLEPVFKLLEDCIGERADTADTR